MLCDTDIHAPIVTKPRNDTDYYYTSSKNVKYDTMATGETKTQPSILEQ